MQKEEWAAVAFATMIGGMMTLILKDLLIDGGEVERGQRYTGPWVGLAFGTLAITVLVASWRNGHFGDAARNGRAERPLVFWTFFASFLYAALVLGIMAFLDLTANGF